MDTDATLICGDNLKEMKAMPDDSVDLVMGSGPYESARTYGVGFNLKGQPFVDWMAERWIEMQRVSRGLVAMVIEGQTKNFQWSATPALLMADLHRAGLKLRKPLMFHRVGIPGSGGPDWMRGDTEWIVCTTKGKLPWSSNTAMGHPPKWAPGGAMSNRKMDGARVNQWGHSIDSGATVVDAGGVVRSQGTRPSHRIVTKQKEGMHGGQENSYYREPSLANPGNVVCETYTAPEVVSLLQHAGDMTHHNVGGGVMGSKLSHDNEAPFPETLAEFLIRSFCPPGGIVLDPFSGSATTGAVAIKHGRRYIGIDIRESMRELGERRIAEAREKLAKEQVA